MREHPSTRPKYWWRHLAKRPKYWVLENVVGLMKVDKGAVWRFKTFTLFPMIAWLRNLDHICRWLFPLAYGIYFIAAFSQVGWGMEHARLISSTHCGSLYK